MTEGLAKAALSDRDVLEAWERGDGRPPPDRALAVVAQGHPGGEGELAHRPLGMLDADLLATHAATFGERVEGVVSCPACGESLELSLETDDLRAGHADPGAEYSLDRAGHRVTFRAATAADLRAAARSGSPREVLVERCVTAAEGDGRAVDAGRLPDEVVSALSERMAAIDPQADLRLALECPDCAHHWSERLDLGDFVWRELEARARRLFLDVARLAAGYGWDEDAILRLSSPRRRVYLDLLDG